jgi:hypothetical protein
MNEINEFRGEYRWLSNFWSCDIVMDGIHYPSTEHAYQAAKTHDIDDKVYIANLKKFGDARRYGQTVKIHPEFDHDKIQIMKDALTQKFAVPELRLKLKETGDKILIEGNTWHDNFWGTCFCEKCGNKGKNILGKLLMEIRNGI